MLKLLDRGFLAESPPLYVRVSPESPPAPLLLFDVSTDAGPFARALTARQVDYVARERGLRVVPVIE